MNPRTFKLLLGLAGVALVGAGLFVQSRSDTGETEQRPAQSLSRSLPGAASADGRDIGCPIAAGDTFAYSFEQSVRAHVDAAAFGMPEGTPDAEVARAVSAVVDLRAVDANAESALLVGRMRRVMASGPDMSASPFMIEVHRDCSIAAFGRHRTARLSAAQAQQGLLAELDFRFGDEDLQRYDAMNAVGRYAGVSARAEDPGGLLLQRRVERYEERWDQSQTFDARPTQSLLSVRVGSGPWFASMRGSEELGGSSSSIQTLRVVATERLDGVFDEVSTERGDYIFENLLPRQLRTRTPRPVTRSERERQERVAHLTPNQAVDTYIQRVRAGVGIESTWPPLTDYLEARPEQTPAVVHRIQDATIPDAAVPGVYIALSRARTDIARRALVEIAEDAGAPPMERTRALFALVDRDDVSAPEAELMRGLSHNLDAEHEDDAFVGRHSLLALGTMGSLQNDPEIVAIAYTGVEEALGVATDAALLTPVFGAIGNLGDARFLPRIERFATDPRRDVRESATHVLQRLRPSVSAPFVARWLEREDSPVVKRRLYRTLYEQTIESEEPQPPDIVALAIEDLAQEPDFVTRKALIRIIGGAAEDMPDAREALRRQVAYEVGAHQGLLSTLARYMSGTDLREAMNERTVIAGRTP